jgi:DNA-binding MurR/RpiR family transcriptional regulator
VRGSDEILAALTERYASLSPKLARAAKLVLDDPTFIAFNSVRSVARNAGVTPTTMVRLAREIGFERYEEFRACFQRSIADERSGLGGRARRLHEIGTTGSADRLVQDVLTSTMSNIEEMLCKPIVEKLVVVSDLIKKSSNTHLVAAGAPRWIASAFYASAYMAAPSLRPPRTTGASIIEDYLQVKKGDLALCFMVQPYGAESAAAAQFVKKRGATIVAFSDSLTSPLAPLADQFILVPTDSPQLFPSLIGILTVLETLTALLVARADKDVLARIEEFEKLRKSEGLYWK